MYDGLKSLYTVPANTGTRIGKYLAQLVDEGATAEEIARRKEELDNQREQLSKRMEEEGFTQEESDKIFEEWSKTVSGEAPFGSYSKAFEETKKAKEETLAEEEARRIAEEEENAKLEAEKQATEEALAQKQDEQDAEAMLYDIQDEALAKAKKEAEEQAKINAILDQAEDDAEKLLEDKLAEEERKIAEEDKKTKQEQEEQAKLDNVLNNTSHVQVIAKLEVPMGLYKQVITLVFTNVGEKGGAKDAIVSTKMIIDPSMINNMPAEVRNSLNTAEVKNSLKAAEYTETGTFSGGPNGTFKFSKGEAKLEDGKIVLLSTGNYSLIVQNPEAFDNWK